MTIVKQKQSLVFSVAVVLLLSLLLPFNGFAGGREFRLPKYEKVVLSTGLTVYLMEQHEVPLIEVSVLVPTGSVNDGDKYGLSFLTARSLRFGTKSYTRGQLDEKLEFLGATYNTQPHRDWTRVKASFAGKDLDVVIPIIMEVVAEPRFESALFETLKKQLLAVYGQYKAYPSEVLPWYFMRFICGDNPYGNPLRGMQPAASGITLDDVKTYHKTYYRPADSAIAIVGDFKTAGIKKKLEPWFKGWNTPGNAPKKDLSKLPVYTKNRVLLINKDDATETQFALGTFGPKRNDPELNLSRSINCMLGISMGSVLVQELRMNRGIIYSIGSTFYTYKDIGVFGIISSTPTEKTEEALDATLEIMKKLQEKGMSEDLVNKGKSYIKGQIPRKYETPANLAAVLTSMFLYDIKDSFYNDFNKTIDSLTVEKAREMITKHFPKDYFIFTLIGKASEIRDKVKKYGELIEKDIKDAGF